MATSLTHQYIPRIEQTEENLFIEEYYSSTDTKIYIDDVEQTEIAYINYSLQEQLKPIYGYSSMTFDDVAIGNRIVVGTLKMPIKNIEANSTETEIESRMYNPNANYNDDETERENGVEWINRIDGNNNPTDTTKPGNTISDIDYEYRTKLQNLGYGISYNSSNTDVKKAISNFQKNNSLPVTGELDLSTKSKIDSMINQTNGYKKITVPNNTKLYMKPVKGTDYELLSSQEVYVLDNEFDDGWTYVMTMDGKEGFIKL